ncbi:hypothetical protein AU476_19870 [Cupriavidus sp. UYMSc13B]|nr:hypothetical protein AU476_19870 [Cupriavidus sp. UYMSc13B]
MSQGKRRRLFLREAMLDRKANPFGIVFCTPSFCINGVLWVLIVLALSESELEIHPRSDRQRAAEMVLAVEEHFIVREHRCRW